MSFKISVIVPMFNEEKYIRRTLDSIINQSLGIENIEVIVVDGCSQDDSIAIVEEFSNKYPSIKLFKQFENKSAAEAKNEGIKHISSDYLAFLDGDDFLSENALETALNNIYDADLLIFNGKFFTEDNRQMPEDIHKPLINQSSVIDDPSEYPNLIFLTSACFKVYSKSLFKYLNFSGLYDDNIVSIETLLNADKIILNKDATYYYRVNPDSITRNISIKNAFELSDSIREIFDLSKKYCSYSKIIKQLAIKFIHDVLFWIYYYNWSIKDELAIIKKLQDAVELIGEDEIQLYKSLVYAHYPIYEEDILNLLNYSETDFLAIYKYFKSNKKVKSTSNLYLDLGNGFNEEDKISIDYIPDKFNKCSFNLTQFDKINSLRFDPVEGAFSKVKILTDLIFEDCNCDNSILDDYQIFTTLDPFYIISPTNSGDNFEIEFKLEFLTDKDLVNIFDYKNNIINRLKN